MSGIVIVSPHLDDAVLSSWLVLRDNPGTAVVSCFAGRPDSSAAGTWDAGFESAAAAVSSRRGEDEAALALTRSRPVHLDLVDVQYRAAGEEPLHELAAALRPLLADAAEVWLPAGIGAHVDHVLTRDAARAALRPGQRARVYADLPYAGQPGWPPAVSASPRDRLVDVAFRSKPTQPSAMWRQALGPLPLTDRRVRRLTSGERRSKVAALRCYSSQLAGLRCGPGHPLRTRRVLRREVSWSLG